MNRKIKPTTEIANIETRISRIITENVATNLGDNSLGTWGLGYFGATQESRPWGERRVKGLVASRIAVGIEHGLAIVNGNVWAWGWNINGQLGDGTIENRAAPVRSGTLKNIVSIAAGDLHSLALDRDGNVYAWGKVEFVPSGTNLGTDNNQKTPTQVRGLENVSAIAAGATFSLALKRDGTVWELGPIIVSSDQIYGLIPKKVEHLIGIGAIACGNSHALAISLSEGRVWAWGYNFASQLGDGTAQDRPRPVRVVGIHGITRIAAGRLHSLALDRDSNVYAWGLNMDGQLGGGTTLDKAIPVQVPGVTGIVEIGAGFAQSFAIDSNGKLWLWGEGVAGRTPVVSSDWQGVKEIAAREHFYAVRM